MGGAFNFLRADPRLALYGLFIAFGSSFGQTFFISQFGGELRRDFGLSDAEFGTIYGLGTLLSAAVIVYTGGIIDRVDLRRWTLCLLPACAGACAMMGSVQGPVTLFIAVFLLRHTGQGLMSHTTGHSLGRYSFVGRGKAIAFGSYGFPLGEAIFPLMGVTIIAVYGWREAWFGLSAAYLLVMLPLSLFLLSGHDGRYQRFHETLKENYVAPVGTPYQRTASRHWTRKEVMRDPRFYLILPGLMAPSFISTGLLLHGVRIAETKGWSLELWASGLIFYAIGSIITGILFGAYIDRVGASRGIPIFLPPITIGCLFLGLGDGAWVVPTFMFLTGVTSGMTGVLIVALWAEEYGTKYLGQIKAMSTALSVFSSAAGPPILGWMLGWDWSIAQICTFCAVYTASAWALSLPAIRRYGNG